MASFKSLKDRYRNLSKDDLINILERSNDAIFIMDNEIYLYLNQAAANILEYDNPEELIGTNSFKHVAPEFREISKNYLIKRSNGNSAPNKYSMQLLTKTGRRVDIETNVSLINFRGVQASLAITRDISEHNKIRQDLEIALTLNETQNQMLIQFLNSVKDEVTIFDSEMRFLYVNDALAARTGNPKEMYLGKHITEFFPNVLSTGRYDKYQEVIKTGVPVKFDRVQPIGDDIWLDIFAFKVADGVGIITSNITDNVRFESTLLELNEYMSRINQCGSLDNVFNLTLDAMANALKHYSHDIFMLEDDHLVQVANRNLPSGAHIPLTATSLVVKSFLENKPVLVNDVSAEPNYFKIKNPSTGDTFDEYEMSRSELVVPIRIDGKAVGVLNVESTEINAFIEQDVTLLEILASTVATAVSRLQRTNMLMTQAVELEINREQWSAFINSATEGFMMFDEDMRYIEANNSWLQYAGLERKDVIGKHVLEVVPGLKETGRYDDYLKVMETGEPVEFRAVEAASRRGRIQDVSAFKAGDVLGIITRDVSDQVRYQRRLEALHVYGSKLSNAVSIEEVAKFTLDAVESVFGYQYSDFNIVQDDYLVPILLSDNNLRNNLDLHLDGPGIIVRAHRTGESQLVHDTRLDEDYVYGRGEDAEWLSELAVPVKIDDEVVAVINSEHRDQGAFSESDKRLVETLAIHVASAFESLRARETHNTIYRQMLNEKLRAEQAIEMEEIKTRFISSATHEIRTPLTSIQGYIELITADSEGLSQGDNLKYFQVIARNVNRLERLTDDLLEIQRMDSKKVNLDLESVQLSTILSDLKYEFVPLLASKSQKLVIENAFEHLRLVCDRLRLMQVFSNLVNNASKFSDEGAEIMIRISVGDSVLRVEVMDEGIGITEKNLLKLFYPFPDIEKGIRYEGTGIGLSICKGIIDLHGGTMKAESGGLGKGSTFIFTIPVAEGNMSL